MTSGDHLRSGMLDGFPDFATYVEIHYFKGYVLPNDHIFLLLW